VGRLGWQLMLFPSQARMQRSAMLSAMAAALFDGGAGHFAAGLVPAPASPAGAAGVAQRLRRAAEELDQKIAQRTEELTAANQAIAAKYAKLQQTESLLRTTQDELVQAGKLAMLGQMAAGMTHELNQPLAAIRAFADNSVKFLARGQTAQVAENLEHISHASASMGKIIGQLKGFARKSGEAVVAVDLRQAVEASVRLLSSDFEKQGVEARITMPGQCM
jgi:two-component system C4-dicarboxylate transport sensor histidine kinase DctB